MFQNMPYHITKEFTEQIKLPSESGKKLRYLMVMLRITESFDRLYQFPTGFAMVSSALKASGREVFTLNLNYKDNYLELLKNTITQNKIDVVLTGGLSGQYAALKDVLDTAKSVNLDIITICGGGIITADPVVAMKALETADYGVIGEGEITVNDIAYAIENGEDIKNVPGIVTKYGFISPRRPDIADLDSLPFPDYDGFEFDHLLDKSKYTIANLNGVVIYVTASRSCPYRCTFCFHTSGSKYRRRSLDNVFEEIDWLFSKYGKHTVYFNDELLFSDTELLKDFCQKVKPYEINWSGAGRVDRVNEETLKLVKDCGCFELSLGVESGSDLILKSMRKNTTTKQIQTAFDAAKRVGIPVYGNIIFGDLEESIDTIKESIEFWKKHQDYKIYLFWIYAFPGSYIYKQAIERGIIKDPVQYLKDNNMQINITKMSDEVYWKTVDQIELFQALYACGIDIDFDKIDMKTYKKKLGSLLEYGKIAVWPTILTVAKMLNAIDPNFLKDERVFTVNAQPREERAKGCEPITGKPIYLPTIIDDENIETVFYAFPQIKSTALDQITTEIKDKHPSVKRIIKIGDLLKE
jgi:radical SAM superfamily enzyme YgiQ (UPF0313 family)